MYVNKLKEISQYTIKMRQVNTDFAGDPEYEQFLSYTENKAYATAKSYKTSYRKLRNLLGKPIRETAE